MLDAGRYLLGAADVLLLAGFASLGAAAARRRLVPELTGATAILATAVLALALLIWAAELLGTLSLFDPLPYLLLVAAGGIGSWWFLRRAVGDQGDRGRIDPQRPPDPPSGPAGRSLPVLTLVALLVAALVLIHFADGARLRLDTGMTGFDSTWYHGPFAVGFFQSGDTWSLHNVAPQFLAWFYPANSELFHAAGMLAFGRDLLSPLLNLGWVAGCMLGCWCLGRARSVAAWSLGLGAAAMAVPAFADQAGEARNDVVGLFFLLAAAAVLVAAEAQREGEEPALGTGAIALVGLAAGLAAGRRVN
jgi:hypothetical protein